MELEEKIYEQITQLCEKGDDFLEKDRFEEAKEKYEAALKLLPLPKYEWEAGTWIYSSIGDVYFYKRDYQKSKNCFYDAMNCPDGVGNPFILLRLGQCLFECGDFESAREFLLRAFMLDSYEIFDGEDKKYFELIEGDIEGGDALEMNGEVIESPKIDRTLKSPYKEQIESIMERMNEEYNKGNYIKSIELLIEAWVRLPEPKKIYDDSFHISRNIIELYLQIDKADSAKDWIDIFFHCNLERMDSGEREFLAGKVEYQLGNLDTAKEFFVAANRKSCGRCFQGKGNKYFEFFKG